MMMLRVKYEELNKHRLIEMIDDLRKRELKLIEDSERSSEEFKLLKTIVSLSEDAVCTHSYDGTIISWNHAAEEMLGLDAEAIIGTNITSLFPDNLKSNFPDVMDKLKHAEGAIHYNTIMIKKDGSIMDVALSYAAVNQGSDIVAAIIKDNSKQLQYEQKLTATLKEKQTLLKEVHHRVKNNLQLISSLLNLQKYQMHNTESIDLIDKIQGRIRTMAIVHEQLYHTEGLSLINLRKYIKELTNYVLLSYHIGNKIIDISLDVEDRNIDIDLAIDIGLVLNELITNSLKYAFQKDHGKISILVKFESDDLYLNYSDDGKGIPADSLSKNTLGMTLIKSIVEQKNGFMNVNGTGGTEYHIKLKL